MTKLGKNAVKGFRERASEGAAAGVAVAAAVEEFGYAGDVDSVLAAQAGTEVGAAGSLAEEGCGLDADDADEVVDDALGVFDGGVGGGHVIEGDPGPGKRGFDVEVAESGAEEVELAGGVGEVDLLRDTVGVGSALDEVFGEREGGGHSAGVGEGAGVREHGGVEAGGHGGRDVDAGGDGEVIDHRADGTAVGVDPVEAGEAAAAEVVVDVDGEGGGEVIEGFDGEAGALEAVALEKDEGVGWVGGEGVGDAVGSREREVNDRDGVGESDFYLLAEAFEEVHEAQG